MYEAPKLERFGNFRQLTLGKDIIGNDLIALPGQGLNECDSSAGPSACRS